MHLHTWVILLLPYSYQGNHIMARNKTKYSWSQNRSNPNSVLHQMLRISYGSGNKPRYPLSDPHTMYLFSGHAPFLPFLPAGSIISPETLLLSTHHHGQLYDAINMYVNAVHPTGWRAWNEGACLEWCWKWLVIGGWCVCVISHTQVDWWSGEQVLWSMGMKKLAEAQLPQSALLSTSSSLIVPT